MKLYDLKNNFNQSVYEKLERLVHWIEQEETHRNKDNYKNIHEHINDYLTFDVLVDEHDIVGFSTTHNDGRYPSESARVATRTYYHPMFRNIANHLKRPSYAELYFIPSQIEYCKSNNITLPFFSVEYYRRRPAIQRIVNNLNNLYDQDWQVLPDMYNTCRQHNEKGTFVGDSQGINCWQNVAVCKLGDKELELPSMTVDNWLQRFN